MEGAEEDSKESRSLHDDRMLCLYGRTVGADVGIEGKYLGV